MQLLVWETRQLQTDFLEIELSVIHGLALILCNVLLLLPPSMYDVLQYATVAIIKEKNKIMHFDTMDRLKRS